MSTAAIDNKVQMVVSNIRNLPTPPIVFNQIQKAINDPNVSAAQIASILSEDPAMSVKVLKLTNSAFYGLSREVDSVKQAVVIIGLEAVKNLVLSASVLDMFKGKHIDQEYQERFWRHSLATGICARLIARRIQTRGMVDPDTAFSSGLLHDVGKMVLSCHLPKEHKAFTEARATDPATMDWELENKVLGFNHAQVGGFLATTWNLPEKLANSITYHHVPTEQGLSDPITSFIHLANHIAKETFRDDADSGPLGELNPEVMAYLQVDDAKVVELSELLREEYVKAETFMQMAGLA
jgi:putative nucleotidyltransferase with HDIG domain